MATVQIGTTLAIGAGTITGSYLVDTRDDGDFDVDSEDIFTGETGALTTRLVYQRFQKYVLNLICLDGAAPQTDFIKGTIAAHADFSNLWVDDARISTSKSAKRVSVTLINIGIT